MHFCLKKCIKHVKIALQTPKIHPKSPIFNVFIAKQVQNGTPVTRPNIG